MGGHVKVEESALKKISFAWPSLTGMVNNVILLLSTLDGEEGKALAGGRTGMIRGKEIWRGQGWI